MKNLYLAILLILGFQALLSAQVDCAADEYKIIVNFTPDNYGNETYWEIVDNDTNVSYYMVNWGTYPNFIDTTYVHEFCIPQDACVSFNIRDSYGDGICCDNGEGQYQIIFDGNVIATGADFANSETISFNCLPGTVCTAAIPVSEGDYTTGAADYWYVFEPTTSGIYNISTCDLNNCNTKIWIYDNCAVTPNESNTGTLYYNDNNPECGAAAFIQIPMGPPTTYYIRIGDTANDCENIGIIDWSLTYIGPVIGCTDPEACNFAPLATEDDGSCFYTGDEECPGPDLTLLESVLQNTLKISVIDNADGCLIGEGCVSGYGQRDLIRFTTHIKNIGEIDYYIGEPDSIGGQFTYDNCHNHMHYDGYAEYILYDENSIETPVGFKNGFCVIDLECNDGGQAQYGCNNMGISAQCGDIYDANLQCQWIDITDIEDGTYTFVARVNWDNAPDLLGRYETNFNNNWAQACIRIYTEPDSTRDFELKETCEPFVDCAGEVYGSAQPDCTGICNGGIFMGDINADGVQTMEDAYNYIIQILGNDISPTSCNDLNADNQINVYDAALLASCLNFGAAHVHPETNAHDHCDFPMGLTNPNDLVTLEIKGVNSTEKYIDIDVTNPDNAINAYQFTMSGVEIMSIQNMAASTMYPITPSTHPGGNTVIGISYQDSLIIKSPIAQPLCRIHYSQITNDEICIASITSIVNQDYEQTTTAIGGTCSEVVGVANPLTAIEANITPNPTKGDAILTYPNTTNETFTLKITDATGRLIRTHENLSGTQHTINHSDLTAGVYLYHLQSDTKTATGKLVVQ